MTTVLPQSLAILQALQRVLETATPSGAEPFTFELHDRVYRGRNLLGEDMVGPEMLPCVSILESPRAEGSVFAGLWDEANHTQWTLLIQGFVASDPLYPTDDAYRLAETLRGRLYRITATDRQGEPLYPDEFLLGNLITGLEMARPVVRPPEKGVSNTGFVFLPVRVGVAVRSPGDVFVAR